MVALAWSAGAGKEGGGRRGHGSARSEGAWAAAKVAGKCLSYAWSFDYGKFLHAGCSMAMFHYQELYVIDRIRGYSTHS